MFRKVKGKKYPREIHLIFASYLTKHLWKGSLLFTLWRMLPLQVTLQPLCQSVTACVGLFCARSSPTLYGSVIIRGQRAKRISSLIHLATAAWVKCSAFDPFARPVICRSLGVSLLFFISSYSVVWRKSLFDFLFSFSIIVDFFLNFN